MRRSSRQSRSRRTIRGSGSSEPGIPVPPPSVRIPRIPPRLSTVPVFDTWKVTISVNTSTTAVTENNFVFALMGGNSPNPGASNWTALYDQFMLLQARVEVSNTEAPGGTGQLPTVYLAADFDNVNTIGTIAAIEQFVPCIEKTLTSGAKTSIEVEPQLAVSVQNTTTPSPSGVRRMWVDSAFSATQWFGIRSLVSQTGNAVSSLTYVITVWAAFRSPI